MNMLSGNSINFGAKVSPQVYTQLCKQTRNYSPNKKLSNLMQKQMQNVEGWGSEQIEIVTCKNFIGNYALGLKMPIEAGGVVSWAFEHLPGKTELSQFLNLTYEHIAQAEKTINFLYKKYGYEIFNRAK